MTTNKSDKLTKVVLAAAGIGISAFLIIKYHQQILNKFSRAKNTILYDIVKVQRKKFDVHIINDIKDCGKIIKALEE